MKRSTIAVIAICLLLVGFAQAAAEDREDIYKLLLHVHEGSEEKGWNPVFWGIVPDTDKTDLRVGLLGGRYDARLVEAGQDESGEVIMKPAWALEMLGGAIFTEGADTPLLDARLELPMHRSRFNAWLNPQWIDPLGNDSFYFYGMVGYPAPWGRVGIETENVLGISGDDDLAIGPMAVVPVGDHLTGILSYQFRSNDRSDRTWFRVKLKF